MKKYQLLLTALVFAGCASQPGKQASSDKSDDPSKVDLYLQGYTALPVGAATDTCSATKSESWKTLVSKASACARSNQWAMVDELAYQISKTDVDSPWGLYFYSLAAEARKDYPRALWMIEAAIKKSSPRIALFRYQKGRIMWSEKPSETALKEIEAAAKADPSMIDAHVFLGDARLRSWDLSQAESHYQTALRLKSNYYEAVRGLADVKRLKGDYKESIPLLSQATDLKPTELSTRVYLATAYEEVKQQAEALATYRTLRESIGSGLIKEKPNFDLNEKIRLLEGTVAAAEVKAKAQAVIRNPAQKGEKK